MHVTPLPHKYTVIEKKSIEKSRQFRETRKNLVILGASVRLRLPDRAFRSNLFCRGAAKKYFRFNPLRGCKPALFLPISAQ
jgi:hypothetical protein